MRYGTNSYQVMRPINAARHLGAISSLTEYAINYHQLATLLFWQMSYVRPYYQMYTDEIKFHQILMYYFITDNTVMFYLLCRPVLNVNMMKEIQDNYISVQMLPFPNSLFVFSKQN
jgi:hypothetical protein